MTRVTRTAVLGAAVAAPLAGHLAVLTGWGLRAALVLAAVQAVAIGVLLWGAMGPGRARVLAPAASASLLAALAWGAARSPGAGLLASAGASHAMLYFGLLVLFSHTLLPGHVPLVTRLAQRLNPSFHDGMRGYTRGVTAAWCLFFTGQLAASELLFSFGPPGWWAAYVGMLHVPLVLMMAMAEYAVRRWRFRGQPVTGMRDSLRAVSLRPGHDEPLRPH